MTGWRKEWQPTPESTARLEESCRCQGIDLTTEDSRGVAILAAFISRNANEHRE